METSSASPSAEDMTALFSRVVHLQSEAENSLEEIAGELRSVIATGKEERKLGGRTAEEFDGKFGSGRSKGGEKRQKRDTDKADKG